MTLALAAITADGSLLAQPAVQAALTALYLLVLLLVSAHGLHRYWLVWMHHRSRHRRIGPAGPFDELPSITVQLPMFNEPAVARRVIDAVCSLDYPRDRLQVQVLDDSIDETQAIARQRVEHWASQGVSVHYLHRDERSGYKAGALAHGLAGATGEFIAVFDADFIPAPDFLHRLIHYFTEARVGMVQAAWEHINRNDSLLTRAQAVFLDGHFLIEHAARHRCGRWINFNGTAGIWRRRTIDDAGGWHNDTLSEDVDLSYRAQLAGWRFVFVPQVSCPAELPSQINAFKSQQHRWAKGTIQCAQKLLGPVLRSDAPAGVKVEAFFHLTGPMVYVYITILALLFYPALFVNLQPFATGAWAALLFGLTALALGTVSAGVFYIASQRARGKGIFAAAAFVPVLMCVGVGMALNNARGVLEALFGYASAFVRTPKYNGAAQLRPRQPTPAITRWMAALELALAAYVLVCAALALALRARWLSVPFLLLFFIGYLYVGTVSLRNGWPSRRGGRRNAIEYPAESVMQNYPPS